MPQVVSGQISSAARKIATKEEAGASNTCSRLPASSNWSLDETALPLAS